MEAEGWCALAPEDNAPVHTAQVAVATAANSGFELLQYPAYFLDLAPSDFYLFPKLKSHLHGRLFRNNDDVIHAAEEYLGDQDSNFFREGIAILDIVGPSALMLMGKIVKSCLDCATLFWRDLELFE